MLACPKLTSNFFTEIACYTLCSPDLLARLLRRLVQRCSAGIRHTNVLKYTWAWTDLCWPLDGRCSWSRSFSSSTATSNYDVTKPQRFSKSNPDIHQEVTLGQFPHFFQQPWQAGIIRSHPAATPPVLDQTVRQTPIHQVRDIHIEIYIYIVEVQGRHVEDILQRVLDQYQPGDYDAWLECWCGLAKRSVRPWERPWDSSRRGWRQLLGSYAGVIHQVFARATASGKPAVISGLQRRICFQKSAGSIHIRRTSLEPITHQGRPRLQPSLSVCSIAYRERSAQDAGSGSAVDSDCVAWVWIAANCPQIVAVAILGRADIWIIGLSQSCAARIFFDDLR